MERQDHDDTQSDSPALGEAVQLENSETLDGAVGGDALDAGYVPPDRPYGLDDDEANGASDTLDERLAREVPDQEQADGERSGRLVGGDDSVEATEVGIDGGAASAEEAAVHDVDGDSLADGEPSVAGDPALADPEVEREIENEAADEVEHAREDARRDGALDAFGDPDEAAARRTATRPLR